MPEDELAQSFKNAQSDVGKNFREMGLPSREPTEGKTKKIRRGWFPNAPEQMKKWFNTTSGFICGVFGGFLMVAVSAAIVVAIGFVAFVAVAYIVMNINLTRCMNEFSEETGVSNPTYDTYQKCREKVGLGRDDKESTGYW